MGKASVTLAFLVVSYVITSGMLLSNVVGLRGVAEPNLLELRCPRTIHCSAVCQGFPYRCVDGKCICEPPPPAAAANADALHNNFIGN